MVFAKSERGYFSTSNRSTNKMRSLGGGELSGECGEQSINTGFPLPKKVA